MWFYSFKLPKKLLTLTLLAAFVFAFAFLKTYFISMPVLGKVRPIYEGNKDKKAMAFTCNVAWGNEYIPSMLSIFEEKGINITFFIEGRWAKNFPDFLKLISSKGHEIGNHGYSHAHHASLTLEQNMNEIKDADDVIFEITGKKPMLFAPPYGEFSDLTVNAAKAMDHKLIMWSIDTIDWKKPGVDYIVNKVLDNAGNGKIVLMHPTEDTVRALPTIIENLRQRGFEITTVSKLLSEER